MKKYEIDKKKNEKNDGRTGRKDITKLSAKFKNSGMTLLAFSEKENLNVIDHYALQRAVDGLPKKKRNKRY